MKKYQIAVHYDMVINVDVIAESLGDAYTKARKEADGLSTQAMECVNASCELLDRPQELTDEDIRRMSHKNVVDYVGWYMDRLTPTEIHEAANGCRIDWLESQGVSTPTWERELFGSIELGTHPQTQIFDRYARLYARQCWERVKRQHGDEWNHAWQQARSNPEKYRVIVETNEPDGDDTNELRYYMVDGSENESCIEHAGQWAVIRSDIVKSPYEVHRPNWHFKNHYGDNIDQLLCRCENHNNITRWASKMIEAGRVLDIYATTY